MLPIVEQLANPALKDRHWRGVFTLLGADRAVRAPPRVCCLMLCSGHDNSHEESVEFTGPMSKPAVTICSSRTVVCVYAHLHTPASKPEWAKVAVLYPDAITS